MPLSTRFLRKYYDIGDITSRLFFSVFVLGGTLGFLFIATNYYFYANNQLQTIKTKILKTGKSSHHKHRNRCKYSYAEVKIDGIDKSMTFPCEFEIEQYNFVIVTVQKGIFGFDIIKEHTAATD